MISNVSYPNQLRNYCIFDEKRVSQRKNLDTLKKSLENPKNEDEIVEDLYILNCMLDEGEKGVAELYPTLSKYNNTKNPNIRACSCHQALCRRKTHQSPLIWSRYKAPRSRFHQPF